MEEYCSGTALTFETKKVKNKDVEYYVAGNGQSKLRNSSKFGIDVEIVWFQFRCAHVC